MYEAMELIDNIASTDVTVLITGESGTGKEVLADEIYHRSRRNNKPFIKVNCAAIPEELLESELFGYEGGAFTDARKSGKIGLFELANEGTILLDEIGEMQLSLQAKLLRVLQTKEIRRIGGDKPIMLDIRVMASTNKDLQEEIKKGKFREDLYYRLNVVPILVKPLRERKEMIPDLTMGFLNKYNKKYNKNAVVQEEVMKLLTEYKWPGNIRELENLIERMVVINNDGIIKYSSIASILESEINQDDCSDTRTLKDMVERLEKDVIKKSIKKYGSVNKAASYLGLSQPALWKKCDIVLNLTTSGDLNATDETRQAHLEALRPDMASYDCGSMNWMHSGLFLNHPKFLEELGTNMKKWGVKPEVEVFDPGMIGNAAYYIKKGILDTPVHFQFCMGVANGISGTMKDLLFMKDTLDRLAPGSTWGCFGVGKYAMEMLYGAVALGGHIRVGMEDNVMYSKGQLAKSNRQFVERARRVIEEYGNEVASPDEAREILGLRK